MKSSHLFTHVFDERKDEDSILSGIITPPIIFRRKMISGYSSLMCPASALTRQKSPQGKILATAAGAKWDSRYAYDPPHTSSYYLKCCLGGVLSCGLTHLMVTPLDVAKCNMQVTEWKVLINCTNNNFLVS